MAIPGGKKPVDLAADFLRLLYEYTLESIGKKLHLFTEKLEEGEVEIKCCLTVPAVGNHVCICGESIADYLVVGLG